MSLFRIEGVYRNKGMISHASNSAKSLTSLRRQRLGEGKQGQMLQPFHYRLCVRRHGGWLPPSADRFLLKLPVSGPSGLSLHVYDITGTQVGVCASTAYPERTPNNRERDWPRGHTCVRGQQDLYANGRTLVKVPVGIGQNLEMRHYIVSDVASDN